MTYVEFKIQYNKFFITMTKYHPNEIGSSIYAEKMADLAEKYPEFEVRLEAELDAEFYPEIKE
jgi:hypothetical protein